ncbi:1-aminocyclopropane-1-carboxylate oxidase 1-like isoform X1 [Tasmannia lanceolata]|uniref:1-aminocyclopropane-1-carboxylate oxidase 1-like n=2 Tax=Tasmannia lanceolata TaxID=3420 RepID=UPI004062DCD4
MEIPVIDLDGLDGTKRGETMVLLQEACEKWGFFQVANHGVDEGLMEKLKGLVNLHYKERMKERFYKSEMAKGFLEECPKPWTASDVDWESTFSVRYLPTSNIDDLTSLTEKLREAIQEYIKQVIKLAERLLELMSENLGLEKGYLKNKFLGDDGRPYVGTKLAKYPECPQPELVKGLRSHTDAGGIILLLQDDQVPGLQFLKDEEWADIPATPSLGGKSTIFVNTGDQLEVLSNGRYKSALHRVLANKEGSRLSIATFYNPAAEALISPAPDLLYPDSFRFQDYLNLYATTKFSDKGPRFQAMKKMSPSSSSLLV